MDSPEKRAIQDTQDEEKQNKDTTQYVLDTTMCEQIHEIIKEKRLNSDGQQIHHYQ